MSIRKPASCPSLSPSLFLSLSSLSLSSVPPGAHRPGREGHPSWARASADSGADRSRAFSSNHALGALSARIAEKCVDAQCSRFWKTLPKRRSSFFNTNSSLAKVVCKERVFGKTAEQAVRVPVPLVFSSHKKPAHLSSRPSNEFTIFDIISAHRAKKKNMQRENFGPDSVKQSCELETDAGSRRFCQASLAEATKGELKAGTQRRPRAATERRICEPRRTP